MNVPALPEDGTEDAGRPVDPVADDTFGGSRFASAELMRKAHTDLLGQDDETEASEHFLRDAFLNQVGIFLIKGEKTGAILDDPQDRWAAQSQLDYWYTVLYRASKQPDRPRLAAFDENAVPALDDRRCPYRGLEAFESSDNALYYGRQKLLNDLLARMAEVPLVAVVGSSGSGKSSLVRAGLIPAIGSWQVIAGSDQWLILPTMLPGSNPLENLARTLLRLETWEGGSPSWFRPPSTDPQELAQTFLERPDGLASILGHADAPAVVLFIDQFEEVFTLCDRPERAQALIANLVELLRPVENMGSRHHVVLTMRSDYEAYLMKHDELRRLFERGRVQVTPLERDELRQAIEEPARQVGLVFERGLVDKLIDDTFGEPGALPLLQFTLTRLWRGRRRNKVSLEAYTALGGARLALATVADAFFDRLIPEEKETAKRIFLRIVRPGVGLEVTNQRIAERELFTPGEDHDRIGWVLTRLNQEGLVRRTAGLRPEDTQVEVAHEALVRNWPALVGWLNEDRAAIVVRQRLADKVAEWVRRGRGQDALLDPSQRADAERWLESADAIRLGAMPNLAELIAASREAEENRRAEEAVRVSQLQKAEDRTKEETLGRLRATRAGLIASLTLLVWSMVLLGVSYWQWRVAILQTRTARAETKRANESAEQARALFRIAESRRLAAASDAVGPHRLDLAMLLALEAEKEANTLEARAILQRALEARPEVVRFLAVPEGNLTSIAFAPDGTIAAGYSHRTGNHGGVVLFDAGGERLRPAPLAVDDGKVTSVAFGPGRKIAVGYGITDDGERAGGVMLFDARGVRLGPGRLEIDEGDVTSVAFGPEGKLAAGYRAGGDGGGIVIFDAQGKRLATASVDVGGGVESVAFGPAGMIAAGCSGRSGRIVGGLVLLDALGKQLQTLPLTVKEGYVSRVAFGPDGKLAVVTRAGVFFVDANGKRLPAVPLDVDEGQTTSVAFGPEGTIALGYRAGGGNFGGGIVLFNSRGERLRPALWVTEGGVESVAFGPGSTLAAGYGGYDLSGVVLFDAARNRLASAPLAVAEGVVLGVAVGKNGTLAAGYGGENDTGGVVLFDDRGRRLPGEPLAITKGAVTSVAFSPDGRLAAGFNARTRATGGVMLFEASGDRLRAVPREIVESRVAGVAFGPRGTLAVGCSSPVGVHNNGVALFDASGEQVRRVQLLEVNEGTVTSVALGPEETIAAGYGAGVSNGGVVLFGARGERLRDGPLEVKEGVVTSVAFGMDGTLAAGYTRGGVGGAVLFNARGERVRTEPVEVREGRVRGVAFGPRDVIAVGFSDDAIGGVVLMDARGDRVWPAPLHVDFAAPVTSVAFGPQGTLAAGYGRGTSGTVILFDVDPASWLRKAAATANRNITWSEWKRYFPDTPYRRTVRSLPWPYDLPEEERKQAETAENDGSRESSPS